MRKIITNEQERREFVRLVMEASLDKPLIAEFKVYRKQRSKNQNNTLWMWLRCISAETGNDLDTLYTHFCEKFLGWEESEVLGEYHRQVHGTSKLNTKEFTDFLESIRMDMMQNQNIYLPLPGDQGYDEFYVTYKKES